MTQEQNIREYLQRARQAEAWAAAVDDAFLKQQWLTIATSYRALAKARHPSGAPDMPSRLNL